MELKIEVGGETKRENGGKEGSTRRKERQRKEKVGTEKGRAPVYTPASLSQKGSWGKQC